MKELNIVSFAIKLNGIVSKTKLNSLFTIVKQGECFYIADFEDRLICEIFPINLGDDAKEYLDNLPNNYSFVQSISKKNDYAMIESRRIFSFKSGIEKLRIYHENPLPFNLTIHSTTNNESAILILNHIHKNKNDDSFLIASDNNGKAYAVKKKTEYVKDENYMENTLLVLDDKEKKIMTNNFQMILLVGDIDFISTKEYLSNLDKMALYNIQTDVQNYLNLWKEYNRVELNNEFFKFRKSSYVRYDSFKAEGNEIKLFFDDENFSKLGLFKGNLCFLGSNDLLTLFKADNIDDYSLIEKNLLDKNKITTIALSEKSNKTEKSINIYTEDRSMFSYTSSNTGFICLSLLGNKISYNRREKAKDKIIQGKAGMRKMYTWFTDNPEPNQANERFSIDGNLLSKMNLTDNQMKALDIICNTPDIAILQGPPGTGKTTVIKEALIQLNAQQENKYEFGNNLLSGFRHETVLNLTDNVDLFGLPAVKVGDSSKDAKNKDDIEPRIKKFVEELIDKLKEKYKNLTANDDEYIEFKKKYFNYISFNNSIDSSIEILNGIKELEFFKYNSNVSRQIDSLISSLGKANAEEDFDQESFLDFLYGMPIEEEGYKDDIDRIDLNLLTFKCNRKLEDDVKALENALKSVPYSCEKVKAIRRNLIIKYHKIPEIMISSNKKEEIINYLNGLFEEVRCERLKKLGGDNVAILDYIDSLTENPYLIRDTLLDYTKVLGATNQQSISKNMINIKNDDATFDNVFIDEAATSSPLDLFIPMSLAKKKIVLVGDHKQLPNIVDEEIIEEVEEKVSESGKRKSDIPGRMKETLFEILMEKAKELEKKDGIKRVITLDTQFRMHPKLGRIVSDSFYEGKIKSIRPESDFAHNYHNMSGKFLYWLDTPYNNNKSDYRNKNSSSRKNIPEAKKIAKHIKEALDSPTYQNVSIGIITIYRDQVRTIEDELKNIGIYDEKYHLKPEYETQEILIGTVDAFQGREFDIVYLSLTYVFSEKRNYSRLAGENGNSLMCVALSRQKKLLIVVGDKSIYELPEAEIKVRPLYDLAIKCDGGDMHE